MKIFAKRKRKDSTKGGNDSQGERTSFASDPIVEELLKKDPSEWNSKEKRMVKRYQQRQAEAGIDITPQLNAKYALEEVNVSADNETSKEDSSPGNLSEEEEESSDEESAEEEEKAIEKQDDGGDNDEKSPKDENRGADSLEIQKQVGESNGVELDDKIDPSHEIFKLLEKLNSKMKRTLSRKLEREGPTVLEDVRNEATRLLGNNEDSSSKKRGSEALENEGGDDSKGSSKKKKKSKVDWSALSPEERLRREEQRKLQKEAAERRAKGEDSDGHKHPLNSERRRANRRKPKWKNTFNIEDKKNHNASGFLARRDKPSN